MTDFGISYSNKGWQVITNMIWSFISVLHVIDTSSTWINYKMLDIWSVILLVIECLKRNSAYCLTWKANPEGLLTIHFEAMLIFVAVPMKGWTSGNGQI